MSNRKTVDRLYYGSGFVMFAAIYVWLVYTALHN